MAIGNGKSTFTVTDSVFLTGKAYRYRLFLENFTGKIPLPSVFEKLYRYVTVTENF